MTNKEINKIASILLVFLKGQHSQEPETVANNAIDMVKMFLEEFPDVDNKIESYYSADNWDDMVYYFRLKKDR